MSLLTRRTRMRAVWTMTATAVGAGVCLAAIAQQPPGQPAPTPPQERDRPGEQEAETHSAVVVDLMSYLEKKEEHERRQREQRPRDLPDRPSPSGDRGALPGVSASPSPSSRGLGQTTRDRDRGIDWTAGDYRENLQAGVPMVLMIEEDSPWGGGEPRPYVVAFDPNDTTGRDSFRELKESAGERVRVSGEVHKQRAIRGLRILTVDRVH